MTVSAFLITRNHESGVARAIRSVAVGSASPRRAGTRPRICGARGRGWAVAVTESPTRASGRVFRARGEVWPRAHRVAVAFDLPGP